MTNPREVISRCLQNEAAAQKQLYEYYAPQMLSVCYRYTKDAREASDILQEGFVRMFRRLHQWKEQGELGAWIRNIMVNAALNWLDDWQLSPFLQYSMRTVVESGERDIRMMHLGLQFRYYFRSLR